MTTLEFSTLCPVRPEKVTELQTILGNFPESDSSPFAAIPGTHVARWLVVRTPNDGGDPFLLFTACVDAGFNDYAAAMCAHAGAAVDEVWGCCAGFPGVDDVAAFTDYLVRHRINAAFFFAPYAPATVSDVLRALKLRDDIAAFALKAQSIDDAELQQAFLATFGRPTFDTAGA
jgi:hypothetical protein